MRSTGVAAWRDQLQPWVRALAVAHAATRCALGVGLLVAPPRVVRSWLGDGIEEGGGRVALRAFAVRDAALGIGMLRALRRGEPVRHWFQLGLAFELVDTGATLLHRSELPEGRGPDAWALLGVAGEVGGLAVALLLDDPPRFVAEPTAR